MIGCLVICCFVVCFEIKRVFVWRICDIDEIFVVDYFNLLIIMGVENLYVVIVVFYDILSVVCWFLIVYLVEFWGIGIRLRYNC